MQESISKVSVGLLLGGWLIWGMPVSAHAEVEQIPSSIIYQAEEKLAPVILSSLSDNAREAVDDVKVKLQLDDSGAWLANLAAVAASIQKDNIVVRSESNSFVWDAYDQQGEFMGSVSGKYVPMRYAPVLTSRMGYQDIIGEKDITMQLMPAKELRREVIVQADNIIGKQPRRVILAGKLIRAKDLQAPVLVKRNEYVKLHYDQGYVHLEADGKALDNGQEGEWIRVQNMVSSNVIYGVVTGYNRVDVGVKNGESPPKNITQAAMLP